MTKQGPVAIDDGVVHLVQAGRHRPPHLDERGRDGRHADAHRGSSPVETRRHGDRHGTRRGGATTRAIDATPCAPGAGPASRSPPIRDRPRRIVIRPPSTAHSGSTEVMRGSGTRSVPAVESGGDRRGRRGASRTVELEVPVQIVAPARRRPSRRPNVMRTTGDRVGTTRRPNDVHPGLGRGCAHPLPAVARDAGSHDVLSQVLAPALRDRHDVIEGQIGDRELVPASTGTGVRPWRRCWRATQNGTSSIRRVIVM